MIVRAKNYYSECTKAATAHKCLCNRLCQFLSDNLSHSEWAAFYLLVGGVILCHTSGKKDLKILPCESGLVEKNKLFYGAILPNLLKFLNSLGNRKGDGSCCFNFMEKVAAPHPKMNYAG